MEHTYEEGTVGAAIVRGDLQLSGSCPDDPWQKISLESFQIPVYRAWTEISNGKEEKRFGTILKIGNSYEDEVHAPRLSLSVTYKGPAHDGKPLGTDNFIRVSRTFEGYVLDVILGGPNNEYSNPYWKRRLQSSLRDSEHDSQAGESGASRMTTRQLELHQGCSDLSGDGSWVYSPVRVQISFGKQ